jgi:outer membrane protein assembly factor BamB
VLYVANRFQVSAYRLTTGERLWQSQPPAGRMQRAQDFALIPMRPLIHGDRIYVRLLYSPGPLLVCLEKSSGKLLWSTEHREREFLISDPLHVEGQLVALGITIEHDQQARLQFFVFDSRTGEVLRQRDLVHLRNTWGSRGCCEIAEIEDGLAVVLGGVTLALSPAGETRWIRTHVVLPADDDPRWVLQQYQRPIVHRQRMYVAQPGVRTVDCLDAATGREHWSTVLPEVVGISGLAGDTLIVRTEGDIRGLDSSTGATRWRYPANDLYSFQLLSDERLVIASRERVPTHAGRWQPRLEWLNPADGKLIATTALAKLADEDPRLGPLVPYKDHLFAFFGRGQHDPAREVVELVASGDAEPAVAAANAWNAAAARP